MQSQAARRRFSRRDRLAQWCCSPGLELFTTADGTQRVARVVGRCKDRALLEDAGR